MTPEKLPALGSPEQLRQQNFREAMGLATLVVQLRTLINLAKPLRDIHSEYALEETQKQQIIHTIKMDGGKTLQAISKLVDVPDAKLPDLLVPLFSYDLSKIQRACHLVHLDDEAQDLIADNIFLERILGMNDGEDIDLIAIFVLNELLGNGNEGGYELLRQIGSKTTHIKTLLLDCYNAAYTDAPPGFDPNNPPWAGGGPRAFGPAIEDRVFSPS